MNWINNFKCRCSGISKLLTTGKDGQQITEIQAAELKRLEDKEKPTTKQLEEIERLRALKANAGKIVLGVTAIEYLMEVYSWGKEGMISLDKESLDTMPMRKGKIGEESAAHLLRLTDGVLYKVYKERIENEFLSGEIDLYVGNDIYSATNITDIKNAFDYPKFLKKIHGGLENGQQQQLQGYGDITGAKDLFVANCLVSFTEEMKTDMEYKVMRKVNAATNLSPEFLEVWPDFLKSMDFEKILQQKRVHKIKVEPFTESERQKVYDRVKYARDFLFKFDEFHENGNKS